MRTRNFGENDSLDPHSSEFVLRPRIFAEADKNDSPLLVSKGGPAVRYFSNVSHQESSMIVPLAEARAHVDRIVKTILTSYSKYRRYATKIVYVEIPDAD